jgi:hypothetical protein
VRDVKIVGSPSRARLSADATRAASTVFVTGHSYLDTGFSTVTEIVDATTGKGFGNLETFRIVKTAGRTDIDVSLWKSRSPRPTSSTRPWHPGRRTWSAAAWPPAR